MPTKPVDYRTRQTGFTLVELVVVIVVMTVLAAIAAPRFFDDTRFAERGYFEELAGALRVARSAAVGTGCPVRFVLTAGGYQAAQQQPLSGRCDPADAGFGQPLRFADGTAVSGSAPNGVSAGPAVSFVFDPLGATDLAGNQTISVGPHALSVQAGSGYVDVP